LADGKSLWALYVRLHTYYKGKNKKVLDVNFNKSLKIILVQIIFWKSKIWSRNC